MAIQEVRVRNVDEDILGKEVTTEVQRTIGIPELEGVTTTKVYKLEGIDVDQAQILQEQLLTNPITQVSELNKPVIEGTPRVVEVGYNPGVMNPVSESILKAAQALGIDLVAADSSIEYGFHGDLKPEQIEEIVQRLLMNKIVEHIVTEPPETLLIDGEPGQVMTVPLRTASEEELMNFSHDKLFLNLEEMRSVQNHFNELGRNPTDAELEIIAARWSEHCMHKTFKAIVERDGIEKPPLFTRIKKTAEKYFGDLVVSAFEDNAGGIRFYEKDGKMQVIWGKVETHNSPSGIEPLGGAMTGIGGVIRDILGTGQGAKVVKLSDMFCFAPSDLDQSKLPPGTLHPDYIQRRVIAGVRDYGNRMGMPTSNGSVHYHEDFRAKPTVIVGAYGIGPEDRAQKGKPQVDDLVVAIGGRTGRDGIHGATFSSGEMTERTLNVNSSAVQIGNAIEEKRMSDAILEARDLDCIRAITDCGAAGFSSAVGEMGEDIGVQVDIKNAPLKYPGLAPWEIWLSESQERMVLAVPPDKMEDFQAICKKFNVEASVLGNFDGSNRLTVTYGEQLVADLDYGFLKNGLPQRVMKAHWEKSPPEDETLEMPTDWADTLKKVLSHGNVCSKEPIVRQYDHGVQGTNALPPFGGVNFDGPNDAVVITPILGEKYGMVKAHGLNPILNRIDPYWGSVWATAEAMANYVAVGGNPEEAALINNYIWPFPDEEAMGSLDMSVDAVCDSMDALKIPVISGKDSLSSTYRGKDGQVIKIPPVLCMSVFGRIPDVNKTVSSDIKFEGSQLYLVGALDKNMGGSTYYDINGIVGNEVPKVDLQMLPHVLRGVHNAIKSGGVAACHDVSEGGIIGAISEMAFGGDCGVDVTLDDQIKRPDMMLFNETAGTFVVEVRDEETAEKLFGHLPHIPLGKTTQNKTIRVTVGEKELFDIETDELKQAWQKPMKQIFH